MKQLFDKILFRYKKIAYGSCLSLALSLVYALVFKKPYGIVDGLFFFGWVFTIVGFFEYIIVKGVFDFTIYSNKKFWQRIIKRKDKEEHVYKDVFEYKANKGELTTDYQFMKLGLGLIVLTTVISIIVVIFIH